MQRILRSRTVHFFIIIFLVLAGTYFYHLRSVAGDIVGLWVWEGSDADRDKRRMLSFAENGKFMTAVLSQDAFEPGFASGTWRLDYKGDVCGSYGDERQQNTCFRIQFVEANKANFSLWLSDEPPFLMEKQP